MKALGYILAVSIALGGAGMIGYHQWDKRQRYKILYFPPGETNASRVFHAVGHVDSSMGYTHFTDTNGFYRSFAQAAGRIEISKE